MERLALILRLVLAARVIAEADARVNAGAVTLGRRLQSIEDDETLDDARPEQRRLLRDDAVATLLAAGFD